MLIDMALYLSSAPSKISSTSRALRSVILVANAAGPSPTVTNIQSLKWFLATLFY